MSTLPHVLMIEDDDRLAAMVASYLQQNGFAVQVCETARDGSNGNNGSPFFLVLPDLMLPDADGLDVCRTIQALSGAVAATPIMMLTAKGDPKQPKRIITVRGAGYVFAKVQDG